jgi:hypothetical protein
LAQSEREKISQALDELNARAAKRKAAGAAGVDEKTDNDIQKLQQDLAASDAKVKKLQDEQQMRRDNDLVSRLKPVTEDIQNYDVNAAKYKADNDKAIEKLRIQAQGLELSERDQFVQQTILGILGEQTKALEKAKADRQKAIDDGTYSAEKLRDDPILKASYDKDADSIRRQQADIDTAKARTTAAAQAAYDQKPWNSLSDQLSSTLGGGIKNAITGALTGDPTSIQQFAQSLQKSVASALSDALYQAFFKDPIEQFSKSAVSTLKGWLMPGSGEAHNGAAATLGSASATAATSVTALAQAASVAAQALGGASAGGGGGGVDVSNLSGAFGLAKLLPTSATASIASALPGDSMGNLIGLTNGFGTGGGWGSAISTIASLFGFADGGYTGPGSKYQAAGIVHAGEFVVNAASTRKLGLGFLNSLNGYADGGYVGMSSYGPPPTFSPLADNFQAAQPSVHFAPQTTIHVDSRSDRGAVIQDVQRVVAASQKQYTEQLQRLKVIPR